MLIFVFYLFIFEMTAYIVLYLMYVVIIDDNTHFIMMIAHILNIFIMCVVVMNDNTHFRDKLYFVIIHDKVHFVTT